MKSRWLSARYYPRTPRVRQQLRGRRPTPLSPSDSRRMAESRFMVGLARRIRFAGRALDTGLALLWHFADAASRVLALLGVLGVGVTLTAVLKGAPFWLFALAALFILLVAYMEGAYQLAAFASSELTRARAALAAERDAVFKPAAIRETSSFKRHVEDVHGYAAGLALRVDQTALSGMSSIEFNSPLAPALRGYFFSAFESTENYRDAVDSNAARRRARDDAVIAHSEPCPIGNVGAVLNFISEHADGAQRLTWVVDAGYLVALQDGGPTRFAVCDAPPTKAAMENAMVSVAAAMVAVAQSPASKRWRRQLTEKQLQQLRREALYELSKAQADPFLEPGACDICAKMLTSGPPK